MSSTRPARSWRRVVGAVAVRPGLWATALGQVFRLSTPGWWRRPPFAPLPDRTYVRFRVATQYGGGEVPPSRDAVGIGAPAPRDVVEYLQWCRSLGAQRIHRPSRRR
jgi:hypothetical protein